MSATVSLAKKIMNEPGMQVVVSSSGEPTFVQIPWKVIVDLTEGEKETLEILSDPEWRDVLDQRLKAFDKDKENFLEDAITLEEYRGRKKT